MSGPGASYEVLLTEGAEQDLESIYDHIAEFNGAANTEHMLDQLMDVVGSLSQFPDRGSYPKELVDLGIREYRQIFFQRYRLIYRVMDARVIVYMIADGRRDMQSLLERRLFES